MSTGVREARDGGAAQEWENQWLRGAQINERKGKVCGGTEAKIERVVREGKGLPAAEGRRKAGQSGQEMCPRSAKEVWGAVAVLARAVFLYRNAVLLLECHFISQQGLTVCCAQGLS